MWKNTRAPAPPSTPRPQPAPPDTSPKVREVPGPPRPAPLGELGLPVPAPHPRRLSPPDPCGRLQGRSPSRSAAPEPTGTCLDLCGHPHAAPMLASLLPPPVLNHLRQRPAEGQGLIFLIFHVAEQPPAFGVPKLQRGKLHAGISHAEISARPGPAASPSPGFDAVLINIFIFLFIFLTPELRWAAELLS